MNTVKVCYEDQCFEQDMHYVIYVQLMVVTSEALDPLDTASAHTYPVATAYENLTTLTWTKLRNASPTSFAYPVIK